MDQPIAGDARVVGIGTHMAFANTEAVEDHLIAHGEIIAF